MRLSEHLSSDLTDQLTPEYLANERSYWAIRDDLLTSHHGQWVAVVDGHVVASGRDLLSVWDEGLAISDSPFLALVGNENVEFRSRSVIFSYDHSYAPTALPVESAAYSDFGRTISTELNNIIADTGADLSLLPANECILLGLDRSPRIRIRARGVMGPSVNAIAFRAFVNVGGIESAAIVQSVPDGNERILGRDALNQRKVLFDGPAGQITFDP